MFLFLGGAILAADGCHFNLSSSSLPNNEVLDSNTPISIGGAISCQYANVTIDSSEFSSCSAVDGAIIYSFYCSISVSSSVIRDSEANEGMIYCASNTDLLVVNSSFINNTGLASSSGIICLYGLRCEVLSSSFQNNAAAQLGVIQIAHSDTGNINDCQFMGNTANGAGGAVYFSDVTRAQVTACDFRNNSASTFGGSIAISTSSVNITSTSIATSSANSGGGLYVFEFSSLNLLNCSFTGNSALDSGGTLYVGDQSQVVASQVTITRSNGPYGGAVYMSYLSTASFSHLTASANTAGYSGKFVIFFFFGFFVLF
jgi:predicted outer membrane repeat protein